MNEHTWFSADIIQLVAGHLSVRSYVNLLSVSRLTCASLTAGRAAVVYPYALRRMRDLIREERRSTVDPAYVFERSVGNILIYATQYSDGRRFKTYYQLRINEHEDQTLVTLSVVVAYRVFFQLIGGGESNQSLGIASACISPSMVDPFGAGSVRLSWYLGEDELDSNKESETVIAYSDGFDAILPELACDLCPLDWDVDE